MSRIVEITPEQTHELRRTILRDGTASDEVVFEGDHDPSTFHLGAIVDDRLIAISTWLRRAYPDLPAHQGYQLRGMATEPAARGSGVSSELLAAGLERAHVAGATIVWARARVAALGFYLRHDFETLGDEYTDLTTGLPHRDIVLRL